MLAAMIMIECSQLLAAGADGRWLGYDYALALFAATFPAWALFTLVREWVRRPLPETVARRAAALSESAGHRGVSRG